MMSNKLGGNVQLGAKSLFIYYEMNLLDYRQKDLRILMAFNVVL